MTDATRRRNRGRRKTTHRNFRCEFGIFFDCYLNWARARTRDEIPDPIRFTKVAFKMRDDLLAYMDELYEARERAIPEDER